MIGVVDCISTRLYMLGLAVLEEQQGKRQRRGPNALRAGGATDDKLCGKSLTEIQDSGRWESLSTCKTYIDIGISLILKSKITIKQNTIKYEKR